MVPEQHTVWLNSFRRRGTRRWASRRSRSRRGLVTRPRYRLRASLTLISCLPSRLPTVVFPGRGAVPNLSLTSELGPTGAVAPVAIARGPRRLASGSRTLPLTLPPPVELIRARESVVLNSCSISSIFIRNTSFIQRLPCAVLKCIPYLVSARWSVIRSVFSRSMSRSTLAFLFTRLRVMTFHRVTLPFMKSATGVPTSGFCGVVHSTTSLERYCSFSSFKR